MIKPEIIEKINDAIRIEDIVGDFVVLRKRGVNLLGLCPFHNEKTPSFTVSPSKGIYKCFGCGKAGNAVNFVMEHERLNYPEALKYLAGRYNIEITEEKLSEDQTAELNERESLFNTTLFAQKYFADSLHTNDEGKALGLSYFNERGLGIEIIKKFGLGYCPNSGGEFTRAAILNGYKKEYLEKTSLSKSKDHQLYDTFRGRVMFPIHNLTGKVLGFGGRILGNDPKKPKYINTAESSIYHKGKVLYGLFFAKSEIVKQDNCYVTEGYTDVLSLFQAGIENVVASSGTSLTDEQIKLIRRYTRNITLLFDGDQAGIKASFRGINMILGEGMNVRVVLFPQGDDPDSFARNNHPSQVKQFIEDNAVDFISFKTNLLLADTQNDPIRKASLIKEIAESISLIPEPIIRSLYIRKTSELMEVDERLLLTETNKQRKSRSKNSQASPTLEQEQEWITLENTENQQQIHSLSDADHQEKELIRVLLEYHDSEIEMNDNDDNGNEFKLKLKVNEFLIDDIVDEGLTFDNKSCQIIFDDLCKVRRLEKSYSLEDYFNNINTDVSKLSIDLLARRHEISPNWENRHGILVKDETYDLTKHILDILYSFKLKKLGKMISALREKLKHAGMIDQIIEYQVAIRDLEKTKVRLAQELSRIITQ